MNIQQAEPRDLQSLQRLGCSTYKAHFSDLWTETGIDTYLKKDFSTAALQASLADTEKYLWLLVSPATTKNPIGFAKVVWDSRVGTSELMQAELQKIYFEKSAAGKGFGAQLLSHVLKAARQRKCEAIWLDVLKPNDRAYRFYQRHGFRTLHEKPFATDIKEVGMWVMSKDIGCF